MNNIRIHYKPYKTQIMKPSNISLNVSSSPLPSNENGSPLSYFYQKLLKKY